MCRCGLALYNLPASHLIANFLVQLRHQVVDQLGRISLGQKTNPGSPYIVDRTGKFGIAVESKAIAGPPECSEFSDARLL